LPTQPRLHTLLLYPSSDTAQPALGMQAASALLASSTPQPVTPQPDPVRQATLRLVVLDGTWRQSRAMLRQNPWLQCLPRLSLDDMPPSRYAIRKAHKPGQLSTLEATCAALAQLEGDGERFTPLLHAFDGFVASQMVFRPPSVAVRTPTCVP
jgi:DTW domain-containing protein YfiP